MGELDNINKEKEPVVTPPVGPTTGPNPFIDLLPGAPETFTPFPGATPAQLRGLTQQPQDSGFGSGLGGLLERITRPLAASAEILPSLIQRRTQFPGQAAARSFLGMSTIEEQQASGKESRDILFGALSDPLNREGIQSAVKELATRQEERPLSEQLAMGLVDPLAIGTLGRVGASGVGRLLRGGGTPKIEPSAPSEIMRGITDKLRLVEPVTAERARIVRREAGKAVGRRTGVEAGLLEEGVGSFEAFETSLGAMAGRRIPESGLDIAAKITTEELDEMTRIARQFDSVPGEMLNNLNAVRDLFKLDEAPQPAQLRRLERIFGTDFIDEVIRIRNVGPDFFEKVIDAANIPRSFMSTFDLSAAGRQGRVLGNSNPKEFKDAFKSQLNVLFSEKNAQAVSESIRRDPRRFWGETDLLELSGVEITERIGSAARLASREEAFMSNMAEKIPFGIGAIIRAGARGHTTFLNKLRSDVLYKIADDWRAANKNPANFEEEWKNIGNWINIATGRGPLPGKFMKDVGQALTPILFSPRLNAARIATPFQLTRKGSRGMVAKDLLAFTTTSLSVLALLDIAGLADVKWTSPLSSDFLKARVGPTRIDFWAGFQQFGVLGARLMQRGVESSTGEFISANMLELLGRFARSKLAPVPGLAVSALAQEDPLGRELDPGRQAGELVTPLAIQAIKEGVENGGVTHGLLALPEFLGISVQSYQTTGGLSDMISAEQNGGIPFNELKTPEQITAVRDDPRMVAFQEQRAKDRGEPNISPQNSLTTGMRLFESAKLALEVELKEKLEQGVTGSSLRDAIQSFKEGRFISFNATVSEDAQELLSERRSGQALKFFQDKYHSIDVKPIVDREGNLPDGAFVLDFDARDARRKDILREAAAAGITEESVIAKSPNRFTDQQVRKVVEQFEADQKTLRSYFNIAKNVIDDPVLYREYQTLSQRDYSRELQRKLPIIRRERIAARRQSEILDGLLLKYGYVEVPIGQSSPTSNRAKSWQ